MILNENFLGLLKIQSVQGLGFGVSYVDSSKKLEYHLFGRTSGSANAFTKIIGGNVLEGIPFSSKWLFQCGGYLNTPDAIWSTPVDGTSSFSYKQVSGYDYNSSFSMESFLKNQRTGSLANSATLGTSMIDGNYVFRLQFPFPFSLSYFGANVRTSTTEYFANCKIYAVFGSGSLDKTLLLDTPFTQYFGADFHKTAFTSTYEFEFKNRGSLNCGLSAVSMYGYLFDSLTLFLQVLDKTKEYVILIKEKPLSGDSIYWNLQTIANLNTDVVQSDIFFQGQLSDLADFDGTQKKFYKGWKDLQTLSLDNTTLQGLYASLLISKAAVDTSNIALTNSLSTKTNDLSISDAKVTLLTGQVATLNDLKSELEANYLTTKRLLDDISKNITFAASPNNFILKNMIMDIKHTTLISYVDVASEHLSVIYQVTDSDLKQDRFISFVEVKINYMGGQPSELVRKSLNFYKSLDGSYLSELILDFDEKKKKDIDSVFVYDYDKITMVAYSFTKLNIKTNL